MWGRWDDVAPLYLRLAGVFERVLSADKLSSTRPSTTWPKSTPPRGRYAEAEEFYGKVLAILAPRLGSDDPLVQQVLAEDG